MSDESKSGKWPSSGRVPPTIERAFDAAAPPWDWYECGGYIVCRLYDSDSETRVVAKIVMRRDA